jgi:hypothetical protein
MQPRKLFLHLSFIWWKFPKNKENGEWNRSPSCHKLEGDCTLSSKKMKLCFIHVNSFLFHIDIGIFVCSLFLEIRSHYVSEAGLKLSTSRSSCLSPLSVGITGITVLGVFFPFSFLCFFSTLLQSYTSFALHMFWSSDFFILLWI